MKNDIVSSVTNEILSVLQNGVKPWEAEWDLVIGLPKNFSTNLCYSGVNLVNLLFTTKRMGFRSSYWVTKKQFDDLLPKLAQQHGISCEHYRGTNGLRYWVKKDGSLLGKIKPGSKGTRILYAKLHEKVDDETSAVTTKPIWKYSTVFNVDQLLFNGSDLELPELNLQPEFASANRIKNSMPWKFKEGDFKTPNYFIPTDSVGMPWRSRFSSEEDYIICLLHECAHATGHPSRLDRFGDRSKKHVVAEEELVAELTAAFVGAELGVQGKLENHASYIAEWLKLLGEDSTAIVRISKKATHAANFILDALKNDSGVKQQVV